MLGVELCKPPPSIDEDDNVRGRMQRAGRPDFELGRDLLLNCTIGSEYLGANEPVVKE